MRRIILIISLFCVSPAFAEFTHTQLAQVIASTFFPLQIPRKTSSQDCFTFMTTHHIMNVTDRNKTVDANKTAEVMGKIYLIQKGTPLPKEKNYTLLNKPISWVAFCDLNAINFRSLKSKIDRAIKKQSI